MVITLKPDTFFIFDLDDTLFQEIDFLHSAYRHIAGRLSPDDAENLYAQMWAKYQAGENVFTWLLSQFGNIIPKLELATLLQWYREHIPEIRLSHEAEDFLNQLYARDVPLGLITDGRSITQRNKLKALGIADKFECIIISEEFGTEKPHPDNYRVFIERFGHRDFYFVGDNTRKDFIIPESLGWNIICIKDSGKNIHPQQMDKFPASGYIVSSFKDIQLQ